MIRRKAKEPPSKYLTPPPEEISHLHHAVSDWDADDEDTMSAEDAVASRPPSLVESQAPTSAPYFPPRPTLAEVLANHSPPPWTLSAFTQYLSQNHCLENLEFTMDAERYRDRYDVVVTQTAGMPPSTESKEYSYIRMLWKRLIDAYIMPDGPREINLPSDVRDTLLSLHNNSRPPSPDELDSAVKIIYNLMEESVLVSFLNEGPTGTTNGFESNSNRKGRSSSGIGRSSSSRTHKSGRSRSRRRASPTSSSLEVRSSFPEHMTANSAGLGGTSKRSRAQSHLSSDSGETGLTNDSASASSPSREPMTPPNTPPSSEIYGTSPKGRGDNTWKKMLVWKKKSSQGMRDNRFPTVED
ncbi:MAG: hypothetical protein Q9190_002972 [Brigantiaea leucoxantha]